MSANSLIIISGTSGSGKSIALNALEDSNFYCIDNLPAVLLTHIASNMFGEHSEVKHKYAVSIDSRNQNFLGDIENQLKLLDTMDVEYKVLFIDAKDDILVKRYSETRRKHPLTSKDRSLREAITEERNLLESISHSADISIDTTKTTPHELRSIVRERVISSNEASLTLLFESFGFKYSPPSEADLIFDARCLPNPHWDEDLRPFNGLDQPVRDFLGSQELVDDMLGDITQFIERWLPAYQKENRTYITVGIGCTGGKHRSVYLVSKLKEYFDTIEGIKIQARHRELGV